MKKLKKIIDKLISGKKVRGVEVNQFEVIELQTVYFQLLTGLTVLTMNQKVADILTNCGVDLVKNNIGWTTA